MLLSARALGSIPSLKKKASTFGRKREMRREYTSTDAMKDYKSCPTLLSLFPLARTLKMANYKPKENGLISCTDSVLHV